MAVLTLDEVKSHLNITDTVDNDELSEFIGRAEAAIAAKCGPLEPTTVTARVRGYGRSLSPKVTPILSITSVTPVGGSALSAAGLHAPESSQHGATTIEYLDGGWFGSRWYDVEYSAGRATVPDDLKLAALELIRFYWESQRGNAPSGALPTSDEDFMPSGDVTDGRIPWRRIQHMVEPHEKAWL